MLQQTQAERVVPKYVRFTRAFPTVESLARASLRRVLKFWSGLGYNRRALALQQLATEVVERFNGRLPDQLHRLLELPAIGPYTASAVRVFAFGHPEVMIETNIRAVFIHHFFPKRKRIADNQLAPLVEQTLDRSDPRQWYEALMDYGAWLKKEVANPGRRSRHYVRQKNFGGSNRQLRGTLIRAMLGSSRSLTWLVRGTDQPVGKVERALSELVREGLVARRGQNYIIQ